MRRKTDAEKLDALNRQYKQKNKYIAANYDRIGIVTPKGTRDYIKSLGMSANSYINGLIEADRRRREAAEAADTDLQEAKPQEATQGTASGARTNRHEATKSRTEGRTEAQEGKTSEGDAEGSLQEETKPRGRSRKASGATGGPEEGTTAGSPDTARREPVEDPETGTKGTDAPQPINPGDNLQQFNPYKYNSENVLLYPYNTADDIPPEELPFH